MEELENTVTISVFFEEGITDENINLIGEQIRYRDEVKTVQYISPEQAWDEFARQTYEDNYEEAMDAFAGDNPLENSASYKITMNNLDNQSEFVAYLNQLHGVRKVKTSKTTAEGVSALNKVVGYASVGVIAILLFVSVFLISNTITIGITVRKEEIAIMKLIGATNFFVRAPFIVEGVVIGLLGSVVPLGLVYYLYDNVIEYIVKHFTVVESLFEFVPVGRLFAVLAPVSIGIGVGLGLIGSVLTTRKHLKV